MSWDPLRVLQMDFHAALHWSWTYSCEGLDHDLDTLQTVTLFTNTAEQTSAVNNLLLPPITEERLWPGESNFSPFLSCCWFPAAARGTSNSPARHFGKLLKLIMHVLMTGCLSIWSQNSVTPVPQIKLNKNSIFTVNMEREKVKACLSCKK